MFPLNVGDQNVLSRVNSANHTTDDRGDAAFFSRYYFFMTSSAIVDAVEVGTLYLVTSFEHIRIPLVIVVITTNPACISLLPACSAAP